MLLSDSPKARRWVGAHTLLATPSAALLLLFVYMFLIPASFLPCFVLLSGPGTHSSGTALLFPVAHSVLPD